MGILFADAIQFPSFDISLTNVVLTFHGSCEIRKVINSPGVATIFVMGFYDVYSKSAYDANNNPENTTIKPPIIQSVQKTIIITEEQLNGNVITLLYNTMIGEFGAGALY